MFNVFPRYSVEVEQESSILAATKRNTESPVVIVIVAAVGETETAFLRLGHSTASQCYGTWAAER